MTAIAEKIYDEVLELPAEQRLGLIDKLLESIHPSVKSVQEAWIAEAEKRLALYREDRMSAVDGEEVFQKLQDRLQR